MTDTGRGFFDFKRRELGVALLLFAFFFGVIAAFQILKPLKNGLFVAKYGADLELYAKLANIAVAALGVVVFTYLYNRLPRHRVIYVLAGFFAVSFGAVAVTITSPGPFAIWVFYFLGDLESTMLVAGFWAYLTDLSDPDQAKRLFGPIGAGGVIGGWVGASGAKFLLGAIGAHGLLALAVALMAGLIAIVGATESIVARTGAFRRNEGRARQSDAGGSRIGEALEGARLVLRSKYLAAIVGIMALYEVASQVMDYQFKRATQSFGNVQATQAFMADVYWYANLLSVVVQLVLVSFILRKFGVTVALLVLPVSLMASSIGFLALPSLLTVSLLVVFDNGLNYSLQQTARESLYIPTSPDEKYKARAFTSMFVQRSAKGLAILLALGLATIGAPVRVLSVVTLVTLALMALCSIYAGRRFAERVSEDEGRTAA
jgi:AAA family ATP:ADP antiporter